MPVHNGSKTVARAIDSVANQSIGCERLHFVIVENNSTDNTVNEVQNSLVKNPNLSYSLIFEEKKGIVFALNKGLIDFARDYPYIARIDADDIWHFDKLKRQISFLERNPEVHIVGTQIEFISDTTLPAGATPPKYPTGDRQIKQWLSSQQNPIAHPSVVYRREILSGLGGYSDLYPMAEDYDFWLRAMKHYNFANIDEILVSYNFSSNPNYKPLSPQLACHSAMQAYKYLHNG